MVCRSVVWRCSPAAIFRPIPVSMLRSGRCYALTIACKRRCLTLSALPKPIRRARSPDRSASNAYYPIWEVRMVPENWRLAVTGLVADKTPWTVDRSPGRGSPMVA
jgi:hypothetical protein